MAFFIGSILCLFFKFWLWSFWVSVLFLWLSVVVSHFILWLCIHFVSLFGSVLLLANEQFLWLFHVWVILRLYNHLAAFFWFLFVDIKKILQHKFSYFCCHFVSNYSCFVFLWYFGFLWRHFIGILYLPWNILDSPPFLSVAALYLCNWVFLILSFFDVTLWLLYMSFFLGKFAAIYCHFKVSW